MERNQNLVTQILSSIVGGFLLLAALAGSAGLALIAMRWLASIIKGGM